MNNSIFNLSDEHFLMFTTRHIDNHKNNILKNIFIHHNLDYNNIVNLKQIHSNNLLYAEKPGYYNNYDGIITNKLSKIIPVIMTADCIPLFVYDTKKTCVYCITNKWLYMYFEKGPIDCVRSFHPCNL